MGLRFHSVCAGLLPLLAILSSSSSAPHSPNPIGSSSSPTSARVMRLRGGQVMGYLPLPWPGGGMHSWNPQGRLPGPTLPDDKFVQIMEKAAKASQKTGSQFRKFCKNVEGFAFGAAGGALGTVAVFPGEATKLRMQAGKKSVGFMRTVLNTVNNEGIKGLYRGLGSTVIGVAPEKAVMIGTNKALRSSMRSCQNERGQMPLGLELLAGSMSGVVQTLFSSPKEMLMLQMQLASQSARSGGASVAAAVSPAAIIQKLGLRGLYKGASATALREVPFAAIYFTCYSRLKDAVRSPGRETASFGETLAAATLAAFPAAFLTTPADVIKTRMQAAAGNPNVRASVASTFSKIVREEGAKKLFTGAGCRVLLKAPQFGVALFTVEVLSGLSDGRYTLALPSLDTRRLIGGQAQ